MTAEHRPKILLPIHLDRWANPIASKLRECAVRIPEVDFYSFSGPDTSEDLIESKRLWALPNIHAITPSTLPLARFDAVHHASSTPANLLAAFAVKARSLGKTIHIFTASVEIHKEDPFYSFYILSVKKADIVLAVSQKVAHSIRDNLGRKVDDVVPNGVDLEYFSPNAARSIPSNLDEMRPFVLFVGALLPRKRPDVVLELARRNPDLRFVMLGRSAEHAGGKAFAEAASDIPNIDYLGHRERSFVRDMMAKAALLIFPSELEGLPNVLLEASAMGLPILAQPKSSMPDIVREDVNGWLIPITHMDAWAGKIREVVCWHPDRRLAMAKRARAYVEANFSWDRSVETLKNVYTNSP